MSKKSIITKVAPFCFILFVFVFVSSAFADASLAFGTGFESPTPTLGDTIDDGSSPKIPTSPPPQDKLIGNLPFFGTPDYAMSSTDSAQAVIATPPPGGSVYSDDEKGTSVMDANGKLIAYYPPNKGGITQANHSATITAATKPAATKPQSKPSTSAAETSAIMKMTKDVTNGVVAVGSSSVIRKPTKR